VRERISQRGSRSQTQFIRKKYKKFEEAWNTFQGVGLQVGCDEIIIQRMSEDCRFQFCCVTNKNPESLGFHFYMLLKHLASLQNLFLERITEKAHIRRKDINIEMMKLNSKHIISNEITDECMDSLIENHNSFACLKYGTGNIVRYDMKQIRSEFESSLLAGKAIVEFEDEVKFAFTNMGNPFDMFDSISDKIKPQTRNKAIKAIVAGFAETQRHQLFN